MVITADIQDAPFFNSDGLTFNGLQLTYPSRRIICSKIVRLGRRNQPRNSRANTPSLGHWELALADNLIVEFLKGKFSTVMFLP